ncbi:MAG: valine--tRNA ligase [Candidatus Kerfeldbacteria bacterium]|nr:valine--tRNA ligase [Candidatus Kerfeldbacteria bacterium]
MKTLPKTYDPSAVEDGVIEQWEKSGQFNPDLQTNVDEAKGNFCIVLPPPNATGTLHLGHAMYVIQDIMVRHARMQGKRTLWLPGTDHAAIATQNKVEKDLWKSEHKTRHDIGREALVRRIEKFVEQSKSTIRGQLRKMGFSLDWSRERFTLDAGLSNVVQKVFIEMFNDGLIYRGDRIVNWCPRCQTTLADDEVEYKEQQTPFYYFKYGPFVIGTVRPETKIGDKIVIVHPDDPRYKQFHHQKFIVPWIDGDVEATVIPDEASDPEMGSGAMTITPAHSFVDFELAKKYGVEIKNIIGKDSRLTQEAGSFAGLTTQEARKKFVEILRDKGLLDHVDENYQNNLSVCYRCGTAIEPLVSRQWFIDVNKSVVQWNGKAQSLKEIALEVVKSGEITIIPDRFNKTYFQWIENLHDWCISRQLWYGHRIPVWYCEDCHDDPEKYASREYYVASAEPITKCPSCHSSKVHQDYDVLDTWFSSGMWTFSTLGWPEQTEDFQRFHPTSVLETGYDIIFAWVARMILLTTYATKQIPFKTVYLHGLVRDKQGAKMSKSKGNGIDPLEMSAKYGTDAVRLSLVSGTTPGNDIRLYEEKIAGFRNFVNKLWNISRFILTTVETPTFIRGSIKPLQLLKTDADWWIEGHLNNTIDWIDTVTEPNLYLYSASLEKLYQFTWDYLADWYIEAAKKEGNKDELLSYLLSVLIRLWHPYAPFITEYIYQHLDGHGETLTVEPWPKKRVGNNNQEAVDRYDEMRQVVTEIRSLRAEYQIPYSTVLEVCGKVPLQDLVENFGKVRFVDRLQGKVIGSRLQIGIEGVIDLKKEISRLEKELETTQSYLTQLQTKLSNDQFVKNAPSEIVEQEHAKQSQVKERMTAIQESLNQLR